MSRSLSAFRYEPTPEELAAAALLREKGWEVSQPRCPECNGWGHQTLFKKSEDYVVGDGMVYTVPCSRGCPEPGWFFGTADQTSTFVGRPESRGHA